MATTSLVVNNNRWGAESFLTTDLVTVALDAMVVEHFILPVGFGQLLISRVAADVLSLSGAYVAPAPAYDGVQFQIQDSANTNRIDLIGSRRFVHIGTVAARPWLSATMEFFRPILLRQTDRLVICMPIIAGAGVTGTIRPAVEGVRIMTQ